MDSTAFSSCDDPLWYLSGSRTGGCCFLTRRSSGGKDDRGLSCADAGFAAGITLYDGTARVKKRAGVDRERAVIRTEPKGCARTVSLIAFYGITDKDPDRKKEKSGAGTGTPKVYHPLYSQAGWRKRYFCDFIRQFYFCPCKAGACFGMEKSKSQEENTYGSEYCGSGSVSHRVMRGHLVLVAGKWKKVIKKRLAFSPVWEYIKTI